MYRHLLEVLAGDTGRAADLRGRVLLRIPRRVEIVPLVSTPRMRVRMYATALSAPAAHIDRKLDDLIPAGA